ncbi:MAG: cyclic di-GMP phosphodiesterase [Chloroflexota bacterium]|jgi:putative two-component system response regulator|nr:cyclic di-GMP phosphodiesterase [Chloroflexota bacterium]
MTGASGWGATQFSLSAAADGPLVVVADDDEAGRHLMVVLLERAGCRVVQAADGHQAIAAATAHDPDLILLDVQMPGPSGIEVTRQLRARPATAITPIILVTGLGETADKVAGLDAGASDFITKPFDRADLLARVRAGLRMKAATDRLEDAQSVLVVLATAIEAKDSMTEHHCSRLATHAVGLARLMQLPESMIEAIGYGAVLHDVGKIGVPEAILRKPGPLSPDEWVEMRQHSHIGSRIVQPLRLGRLVAPIVRGHHERFDGAGYPDGLAGSRIAIGARIVTVVDSYDAIVNDRPYRAGRSPEEAMDELRRGRGSQFDPDVVELFISQFTHLSESSEGRAEAHTRGLRAPGPDPDYQLELAERSLSWTTS